MHVHLFHEFDIVGRPHGCSYIRLLQPFSHPLLKHLKVTKGATLPPETPDVAIVERLWQPGLRVEQAENLLSLLAQQKIPMVYTLDDNLLDLNLLPGLKPFPTDEQRQVMRLLAQEARGVIVSTEPLAARMCQFNRQVAVVPNQLDERLFRKRVPRANDRITFGYMGTLSHMDDLLMILQPLRRVLHRYRDRIHFEMIGIGEPDRIQTMFEGLPVHCHKLTHKQAEYPNFLEWVQTHMRWDFAIAPLADTPFNASKSDLKVLDYGILGIPGIFSRTPSYRDTVRNGKNGLCIPNDDAAWEQALVQMIDDGVARQHMAKTIEDEIWNTRTLAQHAPEWEAAVRMMIG
jgi:glycosyltransferase involved in cell wall biosynthesis